MKVAVSNSTVYSGLEILHQKKDSENHEAFPGRCVIQSLSDLLANREKTNLGINIECRSVFTKENFDQVVRFGLGSSVLLRKYRLPSYQLK
jgi:hypothetical protein